SVPANISSTRASTPAGASARSQRSVGQARPAGCGGSATSGASVAVGSVTAPPWHAAGGPGTSAPSNNLLPARYDRRKIHDRTHRHDDEWSGPWPDPRWRPHLPLD